MAYQLLRTEDFNTYIIRHFQCDSDSDLDTILSDYAVAETPKNAIHAGWTAVVASSSGTTPYILGNDLSSWGIISISSVASGEGHDSVVTKTENRDDDIDSHGNPIDRTNVVEGDFATAFGSRNTITYAASEGFVAGGKNTLSGEDSFVFGYQNTASGNQSFTGGYNNTNNGRETIVFGNSNTQESGDNSKYNAIFGDNNTIGSNTRRSMVVGNSNTIQGNNSGINQHIYLMGLSNNSDYDHTFLFGHHLKAVEQGQFVVGAYNKGTSNCWFEVGCGTSASNRNTAFAVLDYSGTRSIKIGNTELTEAQLQALLAMIP